MNLNQLFRSFKQKVLLENFLKASLFALMLGAFSVFVTSLVYHILIRETPLMLVCAIGGGVFAIAFILLFFIRYPTKKKVAVRMDEIGLQERVSTMLEYKNESTEIAQLQRNDALYHIGMVTSKQIKLRFLKREFISCIVCVCLAVTMMFLPFDVFAFGVSADAGSAEQQQIIKDLIDELRQEVKDSKLDDSLKDSLNEIIDELERDLQDAESELEQAAEIEQAKEKMEELLEKALTKKQIGEALQKYELTRALGEAISRGDTEKVSTALAELEEKLANDTTLVSELSETLLNALEDSGVDSTDSLYTALSDFSSGLSGIDTTADSFKEDLATAFDSAEAAIIAALEKQAAIEEEKENLDDTMSDAKDKVLGNEKEKSEEGQGEEGENPEGEKPEGEMPEGEQPQGEAPNGEIPEGQGGGQGEGDDSGEGNTMTESIYDPVSGSVSYGEVYAAYYAEYLAALEAGEVPEDLQEIMDKYFSSLN